VSRIPADEIRRMLDDRIESVLDALNPGWERRGDTAYLTPKSKKDLGSFTVSLGGRSKMPRGCWHRFSQSIGGGSVELVSYLRNGRKDDYADAFGWAKEHLGIEDRRETPEETAERERRKAELREQQEREAAQRKAEAAAEAAEKELTVKEIWRGTVGLKGSHGEAYLVERGLPPISEWPWNPDLDLRFHPSLFYGAGEQYPAIVGRVAEPFSGSGTGIWRIYLNRKEPRKADVPNAKLGLGPAGGGAVRLGGIGKRIGIAEGIESALAAWVLLGFKYPVWAGLSTSGVSSFEPPMEVEHVTVVPDSDRGMIDNQGRISDPPGMSAAKKLKARMDAAGIRCNVLEISALGDALDLLNTRKRHEQKTRGGAAAPNQSRGGTGSVGEGAVFGV